MISRLRGVLIEKSPPHIVLDVQGVGYELELPISSYYNLPELGETVSLRTHFIVREDAQLLIGFSTEEERAVFRELIKVRGIGAKVALAILSTLSVDTFVQTIQSEEISMLTRVPGVGKKTAERLILELRDRFNDHATTLVPTESVESDPLSPSSPRMDAVQALASLGYKQSEAELMIRKVYVDGVKTEELIRLALKTRI